MRTAFYVRQIKWKVVLTSGLILFLPFYSPVCALSDTNAVITAQAAKKYEGVVIDANTQEPLVGVNVLVKGTTNGLITDMEGRFTINAVPGQTLVFSYMGYKNTEVKLTNVTLLSVEMSEDSQALDEVVVTAFGVGQKKESMVGAVSQVKAPELRVPSANLTNSFAGRIAGVTAIQSSGQPGNDGSTFYIRGISTLTATSPLIIIDGVEASSGDLNALDSEVIESFSVLKDATATAMYGTRGANGVLIVTTKSGENREKAIINARIEGYVSMPTKVPEFVDAVTYMNMYNEAQNNYATTSYIYSQDKINGTMAGSSDPYLYPNVNWYDELFKTAAFNQRVNLNVRGGSKRVDYFINANMTHETGMLRGRSKEFYSYDNNINNIRYTFQNNLNVHLTKTATISMNLGVELRDTHGPSTGTGTLFSNVMNVNPVDFPILYPQGSSVTNWGNTSDYLKWGVYDRGTVSAAKNPLADLVDGYADGFETTVRANLKYAQKLDFITPGLKFNALLSVKNWSSSSTTRAHGYNKYTLTSSNDGDYLLRIMGTESNHTLSTNRTVSGDRRFYFQAYLDYNRTFKDVHNLSAMILYNQDQYDSNTATSDLTTTLPIRKQGVAARVSYDYAHKYMAELNMGYNGSENFAEGHRFGFFPSIALGWNISEEKFFQKAKGVIHNLKLRASYGLVGNADANSRFMYLPIVDLDGSPQFSTGNSISNMLSYKGILFSRYENEKLKWEVGYKTNVGVDIGLFNSLNLTVEYFNELRKDIYQRNNALPLYLGYYTGSIYGNYAEVKNWGVELSLDYGKQFTKDFSVQFKGTFSFARNKVLKYAQGYNPDYPEKSPIGYPINALTGYVYAGHLFIDQGEIDNSATQSFSASVAPGDIKYVDIPNKYGVTDGIINEYDQVHMGWPTTPEIIYGFGPSFKYKNWDFSFFFQGMAHRSFFISGFHPFGDDQNRNVLTFIAEDYYSPENPNIYARYPRLTQKSHSNNTQNSDYWLRNGAFLKLKNAEVGYSWKFLRAYVSGSNLLTFSPFKYWDPEMGGGNGLSYPTQRVINFGVQLNFK